MTYCSECGQVCNVARVADLIDWADGSLRRVEHEQSDCCEADVRHEFPESSGRQWPSPNGYSVGDGIDEVRDALRLANWIWACEHLPQRAAAWLQSQ